MMGQDRIETLIGNGEWDAAQEAIEKELAKEPDDHWLWSRLSGVRYEQHDYDGALEAARKAVKIVPDCPLALWSKAGALDMLGRIPEAARIYRRLFQRGLQELKNPDEDAEECWEGPEWTRALMVDSLFRFALCLEKVGMKDMAAKVYCRFLDSLDMGQQGIYSAEDAKRRLRRLGRKKVDIPKGIARELSEAVKMLS
jgi:tetratricopeptide (TPR) repeat protein